MPHSARLAVWTTAWLAGDVSYDDVLDAMGRCGTVHVVAGLPVATAAQRGQSGPAAGGDQIHHVVEAATAASDRLGAALIAWRRSADAVQVAFPDAGDVRGLPGPGSFSAAALQAREAVFGGDLGLVPTGPAGPASSAAPTVVWRAYPVPAAAPDPLQRSDAEHELAVAMRETASLFVSADLTGARADVAEELARARRAGEHLDLPAGFPTRATALAAQAERLSAVLDIAARDAAGGAVDRGGMSSRADALRRLAATVRRARQAAYNAGAETV